MTKLGDTCASRAAPLDTQTLPKMQMPNRDGFIPDPRPELFRPGGLHALLPKQRLAQFLDRHVVAQNAAVIPHIFRFGWDTVRSQPCSCGARVCAGRNQRSSVTALSTTALGQ
jgi:hypothetical protein